MHVREEQVTCCATCGLVQRVPALAPHTAAECDRCGATLDETKSGSVIPTAALSLAALILYVPANIYPIMQMHRYGLYVESTVWGGVEELARRGFWFVALIVFVASMIVPMLKLAGLFFLCVTAGVQSDLWRRGRTRILKFIEVVGPWAMLDVFLLAVLVAIVRLGQIATILPGPGLTAFTGVVVLTLLASATFDPRLIWRDRPARRREELKEQPA